MTGLAWAALALGLAAPPSPSGGRPDWYTSVTSVHWVVRDLDAVKRAWGRLGFPAGVDFGEVDLPVRARGQFTSARLRVALATIDGLQVYWLQPLDAGGPYADYLKQRGEGVFSLNFAAPSPAALDEEVARLAAAGVAVLQTTEVDTGGGMLRIVHLDTGTDGKFNLGLVHGVVPGGSVPSPPLAFAAKRSHFGFAVKDLKAVSSYWNRIGFPALQARRSPPRDRVYRGRDAAFDMEIGWQKQGDAGFEWIHSLAGPTTYDDFIAARGEGLHHLAFEVEDLDRAVAAWKETGFETVQSGAWGDAGKPGSGRYVYLDLGAAGGGVYVELLSVRR
jgi:hypothetical protein